MDVLQSLRHSGQRAEMAYRGNLKRRLERANRIGARAAVILEANAGAARAAFLEPADFINDSFAEPGAPLAR